MHQARVVRERAQGNRYLRYAACVSASVLVGCSFATMDAPPPRHANMEGFDCSDSRLPPLVDVALMTIAGVVVADQSFADAEYDPPARAASVGAGVAVMGVALASAAHGFAIVQQCREAKSMLATRLAREPPKPADGGNARPTSCGADRECPRDEICEVGRCVAPAPAPKPIVTP